MPQTTLKQARRALARSFDDLSVYTIASATTSTVRVDALVDTAASPSSAPFNGAHVYAVDTGQQRRVRTDGFDPATGTLTLATTWTDPADGTEIEVSRLLAVAADTPGGETTWNECIRRACAKLIVPTRITLPITTDQAIGLQDYVWLDRPERLEAVREPPAVGSLYVPSDWRGWRLVFSHGTAALEVRAPFSAPAGSLLLEALRPADTLINGLETPAGTRPTLDTDIMVVGIEELVVLGTLEACAALEKRNPGRPGQWGALEESARARAEAMFHFDGAYYKPRAAAAPAGAAA
jgi:hypothetical protein